jgi:hypothetical protein
MESVDRKVLGGDWNGTENPCEKKKRQGQSQAIRNVTASDKKQSRLPIQIATVEATSQ